MTVDELVDDVVERAGAPIDRWAVAALLESRGLRDLDAVDRYGRRDIFDLADAVYAAAVGPAAAKPEHGPAAARIDWRGDALRLAGAYARGAFFFLPLGLQTLSLLVLGTSQWASLDFSLAQASIVAAAVGLSFVTSAGWAQALGYLGPLFDVSGRHRLTERMIYRLVPLAVVWAALVGAALGLPVWATGAVAGHQVAIAAVYYALLSVLWLATAILYMLRRYLAMAISTIVGLATARLLVAAGTGIYGAHWAGIAASCAVALSWAALVLRRRARATTGDLRHARLPTLATIRRRVLPYFAYGTVYFAFLFVDRTVAWSTGNTPLPIWFRPDYEVGLDGALVSAVLGMAFLEVLVHAYPSVLATMQLRTRAARLVEHNRAQAGFYARQVAATALLTVAGAAIALGLVALLHAVGALGTVDRAVTDSATHRVYAVGLVGYALLVLALASVVFLFTLSRAWAAVRALVAALAVDTGVGVALTRDGPYWHSVFGLAAGALVFAVLTGAAVLRLLRDADYAYYSSF